jgi:hypothetical protein
LSRLAFVIENKVLVIEPALTDGYCAVKLTVNNPPSTDAVRIAVFLPDDWNGRFQGTGGGGYSGCNPNSPSLAALNAGYATVPQCKFAAANQAAVVACDGLDGVTDGVINAWHDCAFDARTLIGTVTACGTITATNADIIVGWVGTYDQLIYPPGFEARNFVLPAEQTV